MPVDNFTEYYARMKANDGDDLDEEYQVRGEQGGEFSETLLVFIATGH